MGMGGRERESPNPQTEKRRHAVDQTRLPLSFHCWQTLLIIGVSAAVGSLLFAGIAFLLMRRSRSGGAREVARAQAAQTATRPTPPETTPTGVTSFSFLFFWRWCCGLRALGL